MLLVAFGVIAITFALSDFVATSRARRAQEQVGPALANALSSVEAVSRISRDFARQRQLVDTHIAEREKVGMERVSAQIAAVDRELAAAESAYDRLTRFDDEALVWAHVRADLDGLQPEIAAVLTLSSQNRDTEAQARLGLLDVRFASVNAELAHLIEINRKGTLDTLARADAVQRSANLLATALAIAAIVLTLVVGVITIRLVGRREQQILGYATQLEQQNRELDAFAGRVAHDLRGPLTAMSMAVSRILTARPDDASGALIRRSVGRMERLIGDLLALSQIDAQSRGATCDPAAVAATVREELAARIDAAEATLRFDVAPARVQGRDGLVIEALANLVENAVKYRRPENAPVVEVHGRVVEGVYQLSVADNGMGMTHEEMRQAFEPFYRARRGTATPGTGLGLSIVKRVAEASGGSVTVQSTVGQGSTFVLRLPLAP